jgi:hypothetical protein
MLHLKGLTSVSDSRICFLALRLPRTESRVLPGAVLLLFGLLLLPGEADPFSDLGVRRRLLLLLLPEPLVIIFFTL